MKIFKNKLFMSLMSVLSVIVLAIGITFSCVDLSHKNKDDSSFPTIGADPTYDDYWYSSVKNSGSYSLSGSGSIEDPYLIGSPEDLTALAIIVGEDGDVSGGERFEDSCEVEICCGDEYFRQTCDIDLSGYYWAPIGGGSIGGARAFGGHYDGGGHSITNLYCPGGNLASYAPFSEEGGLGLFGIVAGPGSGEYIASIKRLHVTGTIVGGGTPSATGGLVGRTKNAEISECNFAGSVSGDSCSGGLVGIAENCLLTNCYNSSKVLGYEFVGGLVGQANTGLQISFCYNKGPLVEESNVEGANCVGGLVGGFWIGSDADTFYLINCFNDSTIKAGNIVGGLVGVIGTIGSTYQLKNCFNIIGANGIDRRVITEDGRAGGLIGEISFEGSFEMSNCFSGCNIDFTDSSTTGFLIGYIDTSAILNVAYQDLKVKNELYEQLPICGEASGETADLFAADPDDGYLFNFMAQDQSWYENPDVWIDIGDGNDYIWQNNTIWTFGSGDNNGYPTLAQSGFLTIELDYQGVQDNSFLSIFPGEYLNYYYYDSNYSYIDFNPARNGFTFLGYADSPTYPSIWYYTTTGSSTSPIEEDMTIYAVWQGNTYTVTLDSDGGTGGTTSISIQYDTCDATISSLPTKTGLVFDGYYTQKNGQGVKYFDENGKCIRLWNISSNTTLYANYVENNWITHAATSFATGSGDGSTATKAYLIETPNQLALLAKNVNAGTDYSNKYFKLTANVDLANYEWVPIGNSTNAFRGRFDGDSYTISGLRVNGNYQYVGLFGLTSSGATVSNVNINDSILISTYTGNNNYVGGILGNASSSVSITNCSCYALLQGANVGGILGYTSSSSLISECKFTGRIIGANSCGGIVGFTRGGSISNCINYSDIEGSTVGGIAGDMLGGTMRNCISKGTVKSSGYVGSIVGQAYYAGNGTPAWYDCAGYGIIYATDKAKAGAIGGRVAGYASAGYFATIKNCSFVGTCNIDIGVFCGTSESINISSSYSQINGKGYYTDGDFSGFTIVENMNNNLPMQNALYSIAIGGQTSSYIIGKLTEKGYESVA